MYAVIASGGKQYRVKEGEFIRVESLNQELGSIVKFDNVLMGFTGETPKVGTPYLSGWAVEAEIVEHGRGEKIRIIKIKRRKHHMKRMGHRQNFTKLKIVKITAE